MNRRTMTLVIAAILAVGAGLLAFDYMISVNKNARNSPPRSVIVAIADIPARASLTPTLVRMETRPSDSVDPDALTSPSAVTGTIALISIPAGTTVTGSNTGKPQAMSLPVQLRRGMRAMSIPVDNVKSVAGLLEAGDHVDVVSVPPRGSYSQPNAFTIMRDIEVLAVGSSLQNAAATPPPPGTDLDPRTVTLEVTPHQADLLAMADLNSVLRLALRSPQEPLRSQPTEQLVFDKQMPPSAGGAQQPLQQAKAVDPPPRAHRPSISPVTVIDGDTVVDNSQRQR
ncbi:MAG: Flp pilus assembly protein CpaB [Candidatus Baltobacteraceae bacterium]